MIAVDDISAQAGCDEVANPWDEADDAVEAEAPVGARQNEFCVEQIGETHDVRDISRIARATRVDDNGLVEI